MNRLAVIPTDWCQCMRLTWFVLGFDGHGCWFGFLRSLPIPASASRFLIRKQNATWSAPRCCAAPAKLGGAHGARAGRIMSDGTRYVLDFLDLIQDTDTVTGFVKRGLTHLTPQRTTFANCSSHTTRATGNMFLFPPTPQHHQKESQGCFQTQT